MLIGHIAVGLAAKRLAPRLPLGLLVASALLLDLIWPIFLLLGLESVRIVPGITAVVPLDLHDYPYTHSLAGALGWSFLAGSAVFAAGNRFSRAFLVGLCVFSHWVLDYVTHAPDMPLFPGSAVRVGLGLWYSIPATLAVEITFFLVCLFAYVGGSKAVGGGGRWGLVLFVLFLFGVYFASVFGPPPPTARLVAYGSLLMWTFLPVIAWIDRNRAPLAAKR